MNRRALPSILVLIIAVALVAGWGASTAKSSAPEPQGDQAPRLVIMSAFGPELDRLLAEATIEKTAVINGRTFYVGELAGNKVVMFLSGVSMVNAAMMAQTALDHFNATAIVFSGIAGGVNPNLNIGDVTVNAQWAQYQDQLFARETPDGWMTLWFPQDFGNYGMMFPQYVAVAQEGGPADAEAYKFWFPVDATMLSVAQSVAGSVALENCTPENVCLSQNPVVVTGGNGVSGPTFVDNADYREWVWSNFQADALDMETAAVAQVAYANDVPYIAFRSLSDLAGGGPGANEIFTFFTLAAENSARVVLAFLSAWATH
ncbi:MAG: 5'-methylthioadenosine/S-adenosylhomocysteine nucleosidase [Anaerolineae bacterium]|nr:5'-methylthioadenosine/S-adenosylhomocysteine nucleosidase [Anaerolineae bacterium]